jgi:hypothetical protein
MTIAPAVGLLDEQERYGAPGPARAPDPLLPAEIAARHPIHPIRPRHALSVPRGADHADGRSFRLDAEH